MFRDKMGAFFIVGFPILMGVFFGLIMGGNSGGGGSAKMKIAIVDLDQTPISNKFVQSLSDNSKLAVQEISVDELGATFKALPKSDQQAQKSERMVEAARTSVRKGQRVGMIVLPVGFGERAGVFWGDPPKIQVGMDPSRNAEAAMVQGFIMEAIGGLAGERFSDPTSMKTSIEESREQVRSAEDVDPLTKQLMLGFFGSLDTMLERMDEVQENEEASNQMDARGGLQFADIESLDIARVIDPDSVRGQTQKLKSMWDISFPQAMMWGVMGCVAGFSISIARERSRGTMLRLQVAPVTKFQILAGKALACFMTVMGVVALLIGVGVMLGMKPVSYFNLVIATFSVAFCFVGIMMTFSVLGKTEEAVGGSGWAINMVMAMLGGGMIPVMFMPDFMQTMSVISPIKWSILSIEGAVWRGFTLNEMLFPCGILVAVGAVGLVVGTILLSKRTS